MENKARTQIVVILDRSGSMDSIAKATVEGFNKFLAEQKGAEGEAFITLVQFDDRYELNYKSTSVKLTEELVLGKTYQPRGSTALHDAIGKTINELVTDDDVIFVIITDGYENASKEFNGAGIKKMITDKETINKWKFLYLGANQDACTVGASMGTNYTRGMSFGTNDQSVNAMFMSSTDNISRYRSAKVGGQSLESAEELLSYTDKQREDSNK